MTTRDALRRIAANGVEGRVQVRGECFPADLAALPEGRTMLSDCEGCERELLDPREAPALERVDMLVELHDAVAPGIPDALRRRFESAHELDLIEERRRDGFVTPELEGLPARDRRLLLSERPVAMQWARLRPCT